jgi:hypothetical protein
MIKLDQMKNVTRICNPRLESGDPRVHAHALAGCRADNARDVPLASVRVLLHEGAPAVALAHVFRVQRVRVPGADLRLLVKCEVPTDTDRLHRNGHLPELG